MKITEIESNNFLRLKNLSQGDVFRLVNFPGCLFMKGHLSSTQSCAVGVILKQSILTGFAQDLEISYKPGDTRIIDQEDEVVWYPNAELILGRPQNL